MKKIKIAAAITGCVFLLSGCLAPDATGLKEEDIHFVQLEEVKEGREIAVVETSLGKITMILFPEEAPKTVEYFKKLVNEGFYNDRAIFTEAQNGTVVTGATDDYAAEGTVETENGEPISCEITPNLWHFSGAVSVLGYEKSKLSKEMLSDSRFFFIGDVDATTDMVNQMEEYSYPQKVIDAYKQYGGLPQFTGAYTVFGQIIDGIEIVDKITKLEVDEAKKPKNGTKIIKIELSTYRRSAESDDSAQTESQGDSAA